MRRENLARDFELLQAPLLIFSAVSLGTIEFIKNAFPSRDALLASKTTVVYTIILVQVLPVIALLVVDRVIAARDKSGKVLRVFRGAVFVVALLLIMRQLQLYWAPATDFADSARSSSMALLVVIDLVVLVGIVCLAIWVFRGLVMFFYYMSPVAIALVAIVPFQVPTGDGLPEAYAQEVVSATQSESKPAVFVVIFDGLAYELMIEDGQLDADSFPNFAALAGDGVWFTNATSNYYWSRRSIPTIIDPVTRLAEQFDIRLYTQYPIVEKRYINDCGKLYTCRSVGYLTANRQLWIASNLALRSFYQAVPKPVETVIDGLMGVLVNGLDLAYPTADPPGWHTFTKKQFEVFIDDIDGSEARGRIYVLHLLLPHSPFAFDEKGNAFSTGARGSDMGRYRQQIMFADLLLGRLMDKVKEEGIYDNSVIAVTSDHGLRRPLPSTPIEMTHRIAQVPLVIHAPGLDSGISDVDYQHIDFGSTLADVLGLPPPVDTEGVSALSQERPERDKMFHVNQWTYTYSSEDGSWRFIQDE